MSLIDSSCSAIFLAFNKAIAEELKARGVNARTFHSLTYSAVTRARKTRNIEANKLRLVMNDHMSDNDVFIYGSFITRMVGLGRQAGIGCLVQDTELAWIDIMNYHDIELENEEAELGKALELCSDLLTWSNADSRVDFDDLLYLAVKDGIVLPKFDFVFVDEAQDTNAIQRAILRKIIHDKSRIIAVGDPSQAIYGFRGADSNSLELLAEEFECKRLPLTVSYRCPVAIVEHARQWVNNIEAAPGAKEGEVVDLGSKWKLAEFLPDDLIVCRTTKPLIVMAYKFLRERIPAHIMGREIGQGLIALIKKLNARGIDQLIIKLGKWQERECEKAIAKKQEARAQTIEDKGEALMFLIDSLQETERTIPALVGVIESLFSDKANAVTLATIHKAKGLEAKRVFWLNHAAKFKWARMDWQQKQEDNLRYVATTRAQESLFLIEEQKTSEQ